MGGVRTRNWFWSSRVGDAHELLAKNWVFVVIPVTKDNGELRVILMHLLWVMQDERCTQAVNVLALGESTLV